MSLAGTTPPRQARGRRPGHGRQAVGAGVAEGDARPPVGGQPLLPALPRSSDGSSDGTSARERPADRRPATQGSPIRDARPKTAADTRARELKADTAGLLQAHAGALVALEEGIKLPYLQRMMANLDQARDRAGPASRGSAETYTWRHWRAHCDLAGVSPFRTSRDAHLGLNEAGHLLEVAVLESFVPYLLLTLKPRSRKNSTVTPKTVIGHVLRLRQIHRRQFRIEMAATASTSDILKALSHDYVRVHGSDSLIPERKHPWTQASFELVFNLPHGTELVGLGSRTLGLQQVDWGGPVLWIVRRLADFLKDTGNRKGEITSTESGHFLTRGHVFFRWRGGVRAHLSSTELDDFGPDDYILIKMCASKTDPFLEKFAAKPIYLRVYGVRCAAQAILDIEKAQPVPPHMRHATPLFCVACGRDGSFERLTEDTADRTLTALVRAASDLRPDVIPPGVAKRLSWHSSRIWLATRLLDDGVDPIQIQHILRWRDMQSLDLYARMGSAHFTRIIESASRRDPRPEQARDLPDLDHDRVFAALDGQLHGTGTGGEDGGEGDPGADDASEGGFTDAFDGERSGGTPDGHFRVQKFLKARARGRGGVYLVRWEPVDGLTEETWERAGDLNHLDMATAAWESVGTVPAWGPKNTGLETRRTEGIVVFR